MEEKEKIFKVKVRTGYDAVSFSFYHMQAATLFAEKALETAIPYIDSDGVESEVMVTISMDDIKMKKEVEKKEAENNELAV